MRLAKALKEKMLDVRLRDKLIHEGKFTREEIQKQLEALPDDAKNSVWTAEVEEEKRNSAN